MIFPFIIVLLVAVSSVLKWNYILSCLLSFEVIILVIFTLALCHVFLYKIVLIFILLVGVMEAVLGLSLLIATYRCSSSTSISAFQW